MQVFFRSRDPRAALLQPDVQQRVRFALRRVARRVPRANVVFTDTNGPRGGVDKRCRIALRTDGHGPVVVSAVASDWRSALDDALARLSRCLLRLWQRAAATRRPRSRAGDPASSS